MTDVVLEVIEPEAIVYKRGNVCVTLSGFHAMQYRSMIWKYGKSEATERFWWLWHKRKEA